MLYKPKCHCWPPQHKKPQYVHQWHEKYKFHHLLCLKYMHYMQPTHDLDQAEETDEKKKTLNRNQHTNAEHSLLSLQIPCIVTVRTFYKKNSLFLTLSAVPDNDTGCCILGWRISAWFLSLFISHIFFAFQIITGTKDGSAQLWGESSLGLSRISATVYAL